MLFKNCDRCISNSWCILFYSTIVQGKKECLKLSALHFYFRILIEVVQSVTKCLRLILVFMWNSTLRYKFNFYFSRVFLLGLTKCFFWYGDYTLGYHFMEFRDVSNIPEFSKILSLKSFGNSWDNSCVPCS